MPQSLKPTENALNHRLYAHVNLFCFFARHLLTYTKAIVLANDVIIKTQSESSLNYMTWRPSMQRVQCV